ncbi:DUF292-domain-containing protein [Trichocladium antarcticum]|uniref:DUF292-domain-containing protein n=1 Tax=Trichocladium antarcticum TaxID=1450529 RepID=A0AAN6UK42_9PEZI|nr:DUF292-domain-containing protein [Trichocladium antarcticum]
MPPPPSALVPKLKVQLKLSIARLRMVQRRDEALSRAQRRAMAQLLEQGKADSARIRVENIIRSDIVTELHEMLELYCELLLARAGLLDAGGATCDPGLEEAAQSLVFAAPKTEIRELLQVRALLGDRFGKEFVARAMEDRDGRVSAGVKRKLSVEPPREELVVGYLEEIAKAYGVDWPPRKGPLGRAPDVMDDDGDGDGDGDPSGGQAQKNLEAGVLLGGGDEVAAREELSKATPPSEFGPASPLHVNPPAPSTDDIHRKVTLNRVELTPTKKSTGTGLTVGKKVAEKKGGIADGIPDVDELAKRFAALKR